VLEGKQAGVPPLVLARFSSLAARTLLLPRHREDRPPWAASPMTGGITHDGGGEVGEGQKQDPHLRDPGKPPKDAKGWPHFTCGAPGRWAAGAGRAGCRLGQGYGMYYATRPSHYSSRAWH
jgi:hypothetical protein